jgi:WD40 repeat protein
VTGAPFITTTLPERPYPGLRPFDENEWAIFFGRERMIDDVIGRLAGSRLVLIHGVSGLGKSSLVRAGVLPKLALQYSRHGAPWVTCTMRPSDGPLWNLAAEFARLEGHDRDLEHISAIAGRFNARPATLASVAASLEGVGGKSVCILVDQFEELFRYEREASRDEAQLFVDLIERAARETVGDAAPDAVDLHIIVTMRSEFLGECSRFAETINRTQYLVPRMDDDGLMRAVRRPALMYAGEFDEEIAERLIASVRGREHELPLLQHGLMLIWEDAKRRAPPRGLVTLDDRIVDEAGGLDELLSRHADAVMASAAPDERREQTVEAVFRALTDVNSEGSAIRRPLAFHKLCAVTGATPEELRPVLDVFRAPGVSFLTPYTPKPIDDRTPIEISHEALIRCWRKIAPDVNAWLLSEFRDGLIWRTLLFQADNFAEDRSSFLSEAAIETRAGWLTERNEAWSERYGGGWPKVVRLVEASREHWERERKEALEVQKRIASAEEERRAAAAQRRIARVALVASMVGALVAAVAVWQYFAADHARRDAFSQRDRADQARREAFSQRERADQATHDAFTQLHRAEQAEDAANKAEMEAVASAEQAKANLREAQTAQSRYLALLASQKHEEGDAGTAALLALEALPDTAAGTARPYLPEVELQLDGAWRDLLERLVLPHEDHVRSAAFSPDGKRVVTASNDGTARLWDATTGQPIGEPLEGHAAVTSAAFSPDGKRIVTASKDNTASLWDAATGQQIGEPLKGHEDAVNSAAFSPDGKRIVTASQDDTARVWDAATGQKIGEPLEGHDEAVTSAAFSPDGKRIVTASVDRTARVWDAATGKPIGQPLKGHSEAVTSAAFSPDGKRIVTASQDNTARLWDAATGKPIGQPLKGHDEAVTSAAFSPDGKRIVTASVDKTVRLWDAVSGKPIGEPLKGHGDAVACVAFSPDSQRIVTASSDKTARIWDAATGQPIGKALTGHENWVYSAAFSPDGKRIVTGSVDKTARIWDAATGQPIGESIKGHGYAVISAAFSPDGQRIVTASEDKTARIWDAATGQSIGEPLKGHDDAVYSAAFSPDGKRIVTASVDKTARIWDAATGQSIGEPLKGHDGIVDSAAFSPGGTRIVTSSYDKTARIWDAATGQPIGPPLKGHGDTVYSAAFSPDGTRIVTASWDRTARIWDAASGRPIGEPFKGHDGDVYSAAFSPDGRRIVTASEDRTARIWDVASGQTVAEPLEGHDGAVYSAAFSPDGRRIVTASEDKTVRLWDIFADTQALVSHVKEVIPRCLTPAQRKDLFVTPKPPAWCIELEKWPYNTPEWKQWLADARAGKNPPVPAAP